MQPETPGLARLLRAQRSSEQAIERLKDVYRDRTCHVLSCGPSINAFSTDELRRRTEGSVVFAVKQAIDLVPETCDFHLCNAFNVRRYRYPNPDVIRVTYGRKKDPPVFNGSDLHLPICARGTHTFDETVAATGRFEDYQLDRCLCRPWGPGIMYEIAFYLALHLGITRIVTIGWDIASPAGTNDHFYDPRPPERADPLASRLEKLPGLNGSRSRFLANRWHHFRGRPYNGADMQPREAELVAGSTWTLYQWLQTQGVELEILSSSPHFDPRIPRQEP